MSIFKGRAKRLDDLDLPRVGALIGVGEDEIHAVLEVEAAGSGFDSQGRVKALYEPHIAYRHSSGEVRDRLVKAGLAYPNWKRNYPKDSYPRIEAAMAIDEATALKATSWGLGQIMGFNCVAAGYLSPRAMVVAFADDEENHLEAMIQFILSKDLDDEIRRHDWAGFARGYNGAGFKANGYDTKLAAAFAKWRKIKDTPYAPPVKTTITSHGIEVEKLPKEPHQTPLDEKPTLQAHAETMPPYHYQKPDGRTFDVAYQGSPAPKPQRPAEPETPPRKTLLQRLSSIFRN
jgi:hypothetical protein